MPEISSNWSLLLCSIVGSASTYVCYQFYKDFTLYAKVKQDLEEQGDSTPKSVA